MKRALSKRPNFLLKFCQQRPQNLFTGFKDWERSPGATNPNRSGALAIFQEIVVEDVDAITREKVTIVTN